MSVPSEHRAEPDAAGVRQPRTADRIELPTYRLCQVSVRPSFRARRAILRNASTRGLGLVLPEMLTPGSALAVLLHGLQSELARTLRAHVVHVTRLPAGGWLAGCALRDPLSLGELYALGLDPADLLD